MLARRLGTKVHFAFAVFSYVADLTVAVVAVDELNAILCSIVGARIRETFVDITFTSMTDESSRTVTRKASYFVDTGSVVVAGVCKEGVFSILFTKMLLLEHHLNIFFIFSPFIPPVSRKRKK